MNIFESICEGLRTNEECNNTNAFELKFYKEN